MSAVLVQGATREWFHTSVGVRQGCLLSPTLFNIFPEDIMTHAIDNYNGTISIGGRQITNLRFADDIDGITGEEDELTKHVHNLEGSRREVLSRAAQTMAALKIIWKDKNIRIKHKIRLMRSLVITIFLYACNTWTLTTKLHRRIQSLEFRCFRKILAVSYKDRITNEQMRKTIIKQI